MKLTHLRVNHQESPLGIDQIPEFSWRIESTEEHVLQKTYRIRALDGEKTVWDSGTRESRTQSFVRYEGKALRSGTAYTWELTVCDNNGNTAQGRSSFETAFLQTSDWKAKWVQSTIARQTC